MRTLTPEQIAKRDERRATFREVCKRIMAMSDAERQALAATHSIVTVEGRTLSIHNQCLIASQNGQNATVVGGFKQWITHGRCVKKGEHGYMIWFPAKGHRSNGNGQNENGQNAGLPVTETEERTRFFMGTVFDVTQTAELER